MKYRSREGENPPPEHDEDGKKRAAMDEDVEGKHIAVETKQGLRQNEMSGRGDRQEFGESLEESEDGCLEGCQGMILSNIVMCSLTP